MAIGNCDCCDRQNVPVSSGQSCGCDVTACFLCQGDTDPDPYCELEEACEACGGDGGHAYPVDIDRRDGSLIEHWRTCDACEATGSVPILCQPIELEDLDVIGGAA